MRKLVFLGALVCAIGLSGQTRADAYRAPSRWSGKFVFAYKAVYEHPRKIVSSWALVDEFDVSAASESECHGAGFARAKMTAARRNPGAKMITWSGQWAGRCWQGEKPPEPIAWSAHAHGAPW